MPIYTAICGSPDCCHEQTYFAKIADRNTTPACEICEAPTERGLDTPMVTAMGLSDSFQMRSPIDGSMIYGRSQYYAHMKKHNVAPESDLKGEAEHRQKALKKEADAQRRKTIEQVVRDKFKP